eukprot:c2461_g1_i1.p1 GENE.c2461_g1_i1~~c2461_g1_i1.p1  ORF type:complete len:205 (+),score=50.23 c2461_g1_i1:86-700(+)
MSSNKIINCNNVSIISIRLAKFMKNLCFNRTNKLNNSDSPFCGRSVNINILDYGERLGDHMNCGEIAYITACALLERLYFKNPSLFTERTAHKLMFASVLVSLKWSEDMFYLNSFYSNVGGLAVKETNYLEIEFLKALDFKIFISEEEYEKAQKVLSNTSTVITNTNTSTDCFSTEKISSTTTITTSTFTKTATPVSSSSTCCR